MYRPFRGAGIRIKEIREDYRYIRVELPLTWYNANYVGTQFGGSMYAMTDPFLMVMYIHNLGPDYTVWDKAGAIEFVSPGRGRLIVEFDLPEAELEMVKAKTATGNKFFLEREVHIHDEKGTLVAKVNKTLYVRKKELAS